MLTRVSLKNPYTIFAICMIVIVLGGMSHKQMVVGSFPEIKIPTILVTTLYHDLSPSGEKFLSFHKTKKIAGRSDFRKADSAFL